MARWILLCCAGIASANYLPALPPLPAFAFLLGLAILSLRFARFRSYASFLLGLCWGIGYGYWNLQQRLPSELEGRDLWITGEVTGIPLTGDRFTRAEFKLMQLRLHYDDLEVPGQGRGDSKPVARANLVRLSWYGADQAVKLAPGQIWQLKVRLKRPYGFANPNSGNYASHLFRNGIDASGYVRSDRNNRLLLIKGHDTWLSQLRFAIYQKLKTRLNNSRFAGAATALALGFSRDLSAEQWQLITATGTNHLFVISGLHLGFVALIFYHLGFNLSRILKSNPMRLPAQKTAIIWAIAAALFYAAMAGFSLPTQRALLMLALILGVRLFNRITDVWHGYCAALLGVLLIDPLAPQSAGFWLSFGAVAGLLFVYSNRVRTAGLWRTHLLPQWTVFILLFPVLLWFFKQASLIAPLANFVAVPLVGLVMLPLCLLASCLLFLYEPLGLLLFSLLDRLFLVLFTLLQYLASWFGGPWPVSYSIATLLLFLAGASVLLLPRGMPARWMGLLAILPLCFYLPPEPMARGAFSVIFYDVGQGLAVLVRTRKQTLLYDTGPKYSDNFNAADAVILPDLRARGIARLDRVVISHDDNDHAGALSNLLRGIEVGTIMMGSSLTQRRISRRPQDPLRRELQGGSQRECHANEHWRSDGVDFWLMRADAVLRRSANDASCVLKISNGRYSILLPGDIGVEAEASLLSRYGRALKADLLVAPHHGSRTSSSEAFVERIQPSDVVITSGYGNSYGHPHEEVVSRYKKRAIALWLTSERGAMQLFVSSAGEAQLSGYREQSRRYWLQERPCWRGCVD